MRRSLPRPRLLLAALALCAFWLPAGAADNKDAKPKSRTFLFTYNATLTDLPAGKVARVWLPVPSSNDYQTVEIADTKSLPAGHKIAKEPAYGNQILYAEVKPDKDGNATLAITYKVTRREVKGASPAEVPDIAKIPRYLEPDSLVPITGKPLDLIKGKDLPKDQTATAKVLYDLVNHHMKYDKSKPGWGRGDAVWACDSKFGNCSDFHSLFISLARSQKIPAKFEIGFPLPPKRGEGEIGGYHCWAFFKPEGKGWVPVDISEANKEPKMAEYYFGNLTEDRVTFSTGRDFDLVPKQDEATRNFFVYPYVEVDRKEYPAEKVKRKFTFKDVE
jgi:transglutaminase-like putative cysteine protease